MTSAPEPTIANDEMDEPERSSKVLHLPTRAATPPDSAPIPEADESGEHDLTRHEYFLNRELTWLNFNYRVLHEAEDPRTPLLERIKFISIVGSNLDEFFMKRIGGLKQQVGAGLLETTVDGRTPVEQIQECSDVVRDLVTRQRTLWAALAGELAEHGIRVTTFEALDEADQAWLRDYYVDNIFPLVTPQATDPAHPFPFVSNLSLNLLVTLEYEDDHAEALARVKVPVGAGIPRFLTIPDRDVYVTLESVIAANLDLLFPGMQVTAVELFRVTRNANTEMDEEQADDLLALIETELRERHFAPIVRLEVGEGINPVRRGRLAAELTLNEEGDVYEVVGMLGMSDLMEIAAIPRPDLRDPPHHPSDHPTLDSDGSIFHIIRERGPLLLHHPYVSFKTSVERFLKEAASDPKVRAIKMTMYRTSDDSKAISHLIDAARNGKQVAVVLELKARFDEQANIRWANHLEQKGVHVTYGVVGLKTHCKAILVVRQDYNVLRRYAHVGTGNYHAGTARLYSDVGMFTADDLIGRDLTELFNYLTTGYKPRRKYVKLLPAPKVLKPALLEKIDREIGHQAAHGNGQIRMKVNALEDVDICTALYRAARAGVQVDLVVRDTCRVRPGIPGLSESMRVVSVVGRFLEHSRIYHFGNNGEDEYYIGSADCMKRNLQSRVEAVVPVEPEALRAELDSILTAALRDNRRAWDMRADGSYVQRRAAEGEKELDSQQQFIEYAEKRWKDANRLKRRKTRVIQQRTVRTEPR